MPVLGALELTLAALSWDPQIRGATIFVTSVLILCGSVYLLLATNTGARVGFLLAAAGVTGWMAVMGWIWVAYGIGLKGDPPTWKVEEVVPGENLGELSTVDTIEQDFPQGWEELQPGNALLGEAQASADHVLVAQTDTGGGGHGEEAAPAAPAEFPPMFDSLEDYTLVSAYRSGGEDYFIPGGYLERSDGFFQGWFHAPHYVVIRVAPVIEEKDLGGAPATPTPDPEAEPVNVVMVRDLGTERQPAFLLAFSMTVLFGVICYVLHQRDKEIMAANPAPAGA